MLTFRSTNSTADVICPVRGYGMIGSRVLCNIVNSGTTHTNIAVLPKIKELIYGITAHTNVYNGCILQWVHITLNYLGIKKSNKKIHLLL